MDGESARAEHSSVPKGSPIVAWHEVPGDVRLKRTVP
jgi:hypothetical protein